MCYSVEHKAEATAEAWSDRPEAWGASRSTGIREGAASRSEGDRLEAGSNCSPSNLSAPCVVGVHLRKASEFSKGS